MVAKPRPGEARWGDPDLRAIGWVGPAPTGWHEPILLLTSRVLASVRTLRQIVRLAGLRRDAVLYAGGALVRLHGGLAVTLVLGAHRIGPVPVSGEWAAVARDRREVVLMLGTLTMPDDLDPASYLERQGDEVVTGVAPVAGARVAGGCRCRASTVAWGALRLGGQVPGGWESW